MNSARCLYRPLPYQESPSSSKRGRPSLTLLTLRAVIATGALRHWDLLPAALLSRGPVQPLLPLQPRPTVGLLGEVCVADGLESRLEPLDRFDRIFLVALHPV